MHNGTGNTAAAHADQDQFDDAMPALGPCRPAGRSRRGEDSHQRDLHHSHNSCQVKNGTACSPFLVVTAGNDQPRQGSRRRLMTKVPTTDARPPALMPNRSVWAASRLTSKHCADRHSARKVEPAEHRQTGPQATLTPMRRCHRPRPRQSGRASLQKRNATIMPSANQRNAISRCIVDTLSLGNQTGAGKARA